MALQANNPAQRAERPQPRAERSDALGLGTARHLMRPTRARETFARI